MNEDIQEHFENQYTITNEKRARKRKKDLISWRREKVMEMASFGFKQSKIAEKLQVSESCISRDISYLNNKATINLKSYLEDQLAMDYEKYITGVNSLICETYMVSQNAVDNREKLAAISLLRDLLGMKLQLVSNASVMGKSLKAIEESKQKLLYLKGEKR